MGLGANGGRPLPTAKDGLPDPFRPIPQMPSNPPVSPPLNLPIGLVPGDPISPGDKTRDLPSGGIAPFEEVDPTRYDGAPPNFLPDGDNDPNACKPRALSKPISDMDELEVLLEVLSRVPCQVGKELRQQVKEILSNPAVLGIMLLVLIVGTIFGGLIFGAILAVVGFVGDAQELAKFFQALFEAKEKNREDKLNEAAVALGVLLASYGAGNMGKLLDALKVFKGGMLKVGGQGISGATKLVDVLGVEAAAGLLKRFKSAGNYRRLEELSQAIENYPRIIEAMKAVNARQSGAAGKVTETFLGFGTDALEILMRRGNPRSLSIGLNGGSKGLGENLEAWIGRLAEVSPQEGARILDGLKLEMAYMAQSRYLLKGNLV
ncbi:hypothetical protein [Leptolyngbya sp. GGD]|uniref:hypothetical protein n=1 Tax=Leptolyngbya sp. GGD TaxID=2997907 RepID=UPI00227AD197|nr:hypothetical protein [Leptolyngbya sp. GGD]MCY6490250.1 hypothetical protein [Leptolyngbya sp. GGD]